MTPAGYGGLFGRLNGKVKEIDAYYLFTPLQGEQASFILMLRLPIGLFTYGIKKNTEYTSSNFLNG